MGQVKEKLFNFLINFVAITSLILLNPLLGVIFRLIESVLFVVLLCLLLLGIITLRFCFIIVTLLYSAVEIFILLFMNILIAW